MKLRFSLRRAAQLAIVLLSALGLKQYYSTASVNQLRWILAPTTFVVELVTGFQFEFESHAGYMSSDRSFVIAASCAGVNFLITAFLMLSLRKLWREEESAWRFIPVSAVVAYLATLVANTVRISSALSLQQTHLEIGGLNGNQLHRLEGIFIYFGFLVMLFLLREKMGRGNGTQSMTAPRPNPATSGSHDKTSALRSAAKERPSTALGLFRQALFPLLIYYATTLGIPLATTAYRSGPATDALWEHFAFVLSAPLILVIPLATVHFVFALARQQK